MGWGGVKETEGPGRPGRAEAPPRSARPRRATAPGRDRYLRGARPPHGGSSPPAHAPRDRPARELPRPIPPPARARPTGGGAHAHGR